LPYQPPVFDAGYLNNPKPSYPLMAKRLRLQGTVLLRVMVDEDGRAQDLAVIESSGTPLLDRAALDAVRAWTFVPARRGEQAVSAAVNVPVRFVLN
jgi:protein TonB